MVVQEIECGRPWLRDDMVGYERYIEEPVFRLPLELLMPWESNPFTRGGRDSQYTRLVRSLALHGQLAPVFVLPPEGGRFMIWDGCRRYRAVQEEEVRVNHLDCLIRPADNEFLVTVFAANMTQRGWNARDLSIVVSTSYERREEIVMACQDSSTRSKLRRLIAALTQEQYQEFVEVLGPRANEVAGRVQRYVGWPDERRAQILLWMARRTKGEPKSVRKLEQAMSMRVPPKKITIAIEADRTLRLWG